MIWGNLLVGVGISKTPMIDRLFLVFSLISKGHMVYKDILRASFIDRRENSQ